MINPASPSESETSNAPELFKLDLAERIHRELLADKKGSEEILSQVKWSQDYQKQKGNKIPWNPEAKEEQISGNLIGFVAEAVSEKVPLLEAQTVFNPKGISLEGLSVVSPQEFAGSETNKKGDVLAGLMRRSFEEKPFKVFDPKVRTENNPMIETFKEERRKTRAPQVSPEEYKKKLRDFMNDSRRDIESETVAGYAYTGGEFYEATVIPDGIVMKDKLPVGSLEVKALESEELDSAMQLIKQSGERTAHVRAPASKFGKTYPGSDKDRYSVGVDLDKEAAFVDIFRGLTGQGVDMGVNNLVILRLPNSIPDNLVVQYGEMIVSCGYTNIVIQKLPFSREEINIIAKEVVKSRWNILNAQLLQFKDKNFSNRDLEILHKYAFDEK